MYCQVNAISAEEAEVTPYKEILHMEKEIQDVNQYWFTLFLGSLLKIKKLNIIPLRESIIFEIPNKFNIETLYQYSSRQLGVFL